MLHPSIPLRPVAVHSFGGLAVTPHHLSTGAALATLDRGGNAADAAIAANATQGVVAPETCGIGGDLFAVAAGPGLDQPVALNSSGRAGEGAARLARELRRAGMEAIPQRHPAAVTVPGCVDGWLELHRRLGRLDLETILQPAIRLARRGFPASGEFATAFSARGDELRAEPGTTDLYPSGRDPIPGEKITRERLAETLQHVAAGGRESFYAGDVGSSISRAVEGAITGADLARPQAEWVQPLSADLFGATGWTIPPNSQGYIALLALAIMERIDVPAADEPAAWHLSVEAYRLAASDLEHLADGERMRVPPSELLSGRRIDELADRYSGDRRHPLPSPIHGRGGTAYLCVVDQDGLGISLIQSNFHGVGSGLSVPEGGFLLHDRGRGFSLQPGHPNQLAPGYRPQHTLSPTLWTSEGRLSALLGTRGGFMQPQLVVQLASRVFARHLEPETAMAAPRWMVPVPAGGEPGGSLSVEPGTPSAVVEGLRERGHEVRLLREPQPGWGPMSIVQVSGTGLRTGAADPRVDTASAGAG